MKKLMFAAAVVAAAFGLKAELASANVVGYYNKVLNNVFKVRAAQFEATSGDAFFVSDAIKCVSPVAVSCWANKDEWEYVEGWEEKAPQVQVMSASGVFQPYYYISDARVYDDEGNESFTEGWADNSGMLANGSEIACGAGIWLRGYKNGSEIVEDTSFTFAGQVMGDDSGDIAGENMFKVRAMPYPVNQAINSDKCDWSSLTAVTCWANKDDWEYVEDWMETAPQIQVMSASGVFQPYYYVSDARVYDDEGNESFVKGWADNSGMLATAEVLPGEGVWFNARKAGVSCTVAK